MEKVVNPTAIHVDSDKSSAPKLKSTTKTATNIGFEPIMGVMRLASPLRRERKQSICEKKKRNPKIKP
tara:strand:- start:447 stop:650 length:204 start_codon:yes stop_codon:yes gene_type:complete